MNINYKKSTKLILLLISTLLIASASAAIYYSLSLKANVTTNAATVLFGQGSDWPSGSSMGTGNTSVTLSIKAYPNATLTYEQALKVNNTGNTTPSVKLRHISITNTTADVANFTFIKIILLDDTNTTKGYLNYTVSGNNFTLSSSSSYQQMDANDVWSIRIETKAVADASESITVNLQIAVDIRE